MEVITCGSYRRGKPTCGDVDILVTHCDGRSHRGVLPQLVELGKEAGESRGREGGRKGGKEGRRREAGKGVIEMRNGEGDGR